MITLKQKKRIGVCCITALKNKQCAKMEEREMTPETITKLDKAILTTFDVVRKRMEKDGKVGGATQEGKDYKVHASCLSQTQFTIQITLFNGVQLAPGGKKG